MYVYIYIYVFIYIYKNRNIVLATIYNSHNDDRDNDNSTSRFSGDSYRATGQVVVEWKNSCDTEACGNAMLDLHNQILLAKVVV